MTDSTTTASPLQASIPQLVRATAVAVVGAGILLVTTVLPAEYGVDPTGVGKALGLTELHAPEEPALVAAGVAPEAASAVISNDAALKAETMTITLQPNQGTEIKALMRAGDSFVFNWTASGPVNFDMHGEPPNAGEEFSSYWRDRGQTATSGNFIAPFEGTHGWYWSNKGSEPVTVTVNVSGFFEKLYQP